MINQYCNRCWHNHTYPNGLECKCGCHISTSSGAAPYYEYNGTACPQPILNFNTTQET